MRRCILLLLCLAGLVTSAWAEGAAKPKKLEPGTTVEMPFLIAPMTQDGKLLGYAYISSKLICSTPDACLAVRERIAFIQDANVREVNARPISLANDPTAVDKDLLNTRLTANAKRIVGDAKVRGMLFLTTQYMPLHPTESTAGATASPEQGASQGNAAAPAGGAPAPAGTAGTAGQPAATSKPPPNPAH